MNSIKVLLSITTNLGWDLQQLDVKNAFLDGNLEEEVYWEIPPSFSCEKTKGKECKLRKALYGLKKSPRAGFDRFNKAFLDLGTNKAMETTPCFIKHH